MLLIRDGLVYDGTGAPPQTEDVAVDDGVVVARGAGLRRDGATVVDAAGKWVMPGFLDIHTHYDIEVEVAPGLADSVRHGVTTVVFGNCSLSAALGREEELLDLFCRVENLPRERLASWLRDRITWSSPASYYDHLEALPLGPNVASFLGHSNVRLAVMGLRRSLAERRASEAELQSMEAIVATALEAGYLGLSIDMLPWHRMDGRGYDGVSVPSQRATPREHRRLAAVVRRYGAVLQATPNALARRTVLRLLLFSAGRFRRALKTTIVAALDVITNRRIYKLAMLLAGVTNRLLGGDVRFQALAEPFLVYADGVVTPFFEEFPTGVRAISSSADERRALFADAGFRAEFRRDWERRDARVYHRDLAQMWIVSAPDASLAGQSFAAAAATANAEPLDYFMDLMARYDRDIRWKATAANDREAPRKFLLAHRYTLPGFNDSGAHVRNMAFHDGAISFLRQSANDPSWLPVERAVSRLTREAAEWLGLDAGVLAVGRRADVVVIDPRRLTPALAPPEELRDAARAGELRMIKRSDGIVDTVIIGGKVAFHDGAFSADFGRTRYGRLLRRRS